MSQKAIITKDGKHRLYWCANCGTRKLGSVSRLPKGWIRKRYVSERLVWCFDCRASTRMTEEAGDIIAKSQAKKYRKGTGFSIFRVGYRGRAGGKR
jgi:hypothetical protein